MRDSLVFYKSWFEGINEIDSVEEKLKSYESIIKYALYGEVDDEKGSHQIAFMMAKPLIDKNNERYVSGKKGGRPPKTNGFEL